eukprot:scaffold13644_cov33-Tisochrysis_lutea.AAC.3
MRPQRLPRGVIPPPPAGPPKDLAVRETGSVHRASFPKGTTPGGMPAMGGAWPEHDSAKEAGELAPPATA